MATFVPLLTRSFDSSGRPVVGLRGPVKGLRPLTRSALTGRSLTSTPQPALPKTAENDRKKISNRGNTKA